MPETRTVARQARANGRDDERAAAAPAVPVVAVRAAASSAAAEPPFSFCPHCGMSLARPDSFIQEYWTANETIYHCWCMGCGFVWNLIPVKRMVAQETDH